MCVSVLVSVCVCVSVVNKMTSVWHKHRNIRQFGDDANDAPVRPRDTESSVSPVESSRVEFRKMSPCHKRVSCCCPPPPSPCTFSLLWWLRVRCLLACYSYIHNTKANGTWQPSQHHFLRHSVSLARSLSFTLCLCQLCCVCMCVCAIYSYADCRDNASVCVCEQRKTHNRERERAGERKKERCTANGSEALQATGKADVNLKILRNWIKVKIL